MRTDAVQPPGIEYIVSATPGSAHGSDSSNADEAVCGSQTLLYVEAFYWGMEANPQGTGETREQLMRSCFEAHGVPDGQGMSDDQFTAMVRQWDYHASTPEGVLCYWDPDGSQGLTVAQAQKLDAEPRHVSEVMPDGSVYCNGVKCSVRADGTVDCGGVCTVGSPQSTPT